MTPNFLPLNFDAKKAYRLKITSQQYALTNGKPQIFPSLYACAHFRVPQSFYYFPHFISKLPAAAYVTQYTFKNVIILHLMQKVVLFYCIILSFSAIFSFLLLFLGTFSDVQDKKYKE